MTATAPEDAAVNAAVTTPVTTLRNRVGGRWEDSAAGAFGDLVDPATGDVVARWPVGCAEDVDRAVAAAAAAGPAWAALTLDVADRPPGADRRRRRRARR